MKSFFKIGNIDKDKILKYILIFGTIYIVAGELSNFVNQYISQISIGTTGQLNAIYNTFLHYNYLFWLLLSPILKLILLKLVCELLFNIFFKHNN